MNEWQQATELLSALLFNRLDRELRVGHHLHGAVVCTLVHNAKLGGPKEITDGTSSSSRQPVCVIKTALLLKDHGLYCRIPPVDFC